MNDERYIDAPLTERGKQQADSLASTLASLAPQLVVTSPLTRAIQTCLRACVSLPKQSTTFVVSPLCRERLAYSCDIGTPATVLAARYPFLDFSGLHPPEAWWWMSPNVHDASPMVSLQLLRRQRSSSSREIEPLAAVQARTNDFRRWLIRRPETKVAVFAHGVFNNGLVADGRSLWGNAEVRVLTL